MYLITFLHCIVITFVLISVVCLDDEWNFTLTLVVHFLDVVTQTLKKAYEYLHYIIVNWAYVMYTYIVLCYIRRIYGKTLLMSSVDCKLATVQVACQCLWRRKIVHIHITSCFIISNYTRLTSEIIMYNNVLVTYFSLRSSQEL